MSDNQARKPSAEVERGHDVEGIKVGELKFPCCFCKEEHEEEPAGICLVWPDGKEQYWWGREGCVIEKMPPDAHSDVHCCFCIKRFTEQAPIFQMYIDTGDIAYICHRDCFVEALHPMFRDMRDEIEARYQRASDGSSSDTSEDQQDDEDEDDGPHDPETRTSEIGEANATDQS